MEVYCGIGIRRHSGTRNVFEISPDIRHIPNHAGEIQKLEIGDTITHVQNGLGHWDTLYPNPTDKLHGAPGSIARLRVRDRHGNEKIVHIERQTFETGPNGKLRRKQGESPCEMRLSCGDQTRFDVTEATLPSGPMAIAGLPSETLRTLT